MLMHMRPSGRQSSLIALQRLKRRPHHEPGRTRTPADRSMVESSGRAAGAGASCSRRRKDGVRFGNGLRVTNVGETGAAMTFCAGARVIIPVEIVGHGAIADITCRPVSSFTSFDSSRNDMN